MKLDELTKGVFKYNPVFYLVLGLCPLLAVSTRVDNALGMSLGVLFVLVGSNVIISVIKQWIPPEVRIPCFIVVIASFVTIVDLFMHGYAPELHARLGIYVPLIVVNCIIFARAEAFASKNPVSHSLLDGIGMGIGFMFAIVGIASVREVLSTGKMTIFGYTLIPQFTQSPAMVMLLPPGAFLTIASIMALINYKKTMKKEKE
ncbi:MAG: electron transport complex subunit E [Methanophagales archaeon ANME-1-THS]|nr:MAG: electron transport complex subunit E [Methanophagales archaeon ANME-1-THS]